MIRSSEEHWVEQWVKISMPSGILCQQTNAQGCSLGLERLGLEAVWRHFLERLGLEAVSRRFLERLISSPVSYTHLTLPTIYSV